MSKKPLDIDILVGRRLEEARRRRGVTQQELGAALGVTFQQVQKYLRGTNRISAGKLYEASRFLNVGIGFFFEGADKVASGEAGPIEGSNSELFEEAHRIDDPVVRSAVKALIRDLSG
ncbi:MAG: helix-turn-helix transcriptional regulator [Hyphomicrobiaceae bacterium]|nr:helix-turn-helix transcriptional regulator [Hyphomicrobiaceae bacterium]